MEGYDGTFGDTEVTIQGAGKQGSGEENASFTLRGCCDKNRATQAALQVLRFGKGCSELGSGFGILPYSNATLRLRFVNKGRSRKFAVKFLSTC